MTGAGIGISAIFGALIIGIISVIAINSPQKPYTFTLLPLQSKLIPFYKATPKSNLEVKRKIVPFVELSSKEAFIFSINSFIHNFNIKFIINALIFRSILTVIILLVVYFNICDIELANRLAYYIVVGFIVYNLFKIPWRLNHLIYFLVNFILKLLIIAMFIYTGLWFINIILYPILIENCILKMNPSEGSSNTGGQSSSTGGSTGGSGGPNPGNNGPNPREAFIAYLSSKAPDEIMYDHRHDSTVDRANMNAALYTKEMRDLNNKFVGLIDYFADQENKTNDPGGQYLCRDAQNTLAEKINTARDQFEQSVHELRAMNNEQNPDVKQEKASEYLNNHDNFMERIDECNMIDTELDVELR